MLTVLFSVLVFGAVTAGVYAAWIRVAADGDPMVARLRQLRKGRRVPASPLEERPPLVMALIARLGGFLPARDGRDALRTGLVRAGYRRTEAVRMFLGTKMVLAALTPLVVIGFGALGGWPPADLLAWAPVAAGVGFYLPTIFIGVRQRQRHDAILAALPDSLDLMVVCVEAGLGMAAALQRVSSEMRIASPIISEELSLVHREMQTGVPRAEALRNLAHRTGVEDVYALVAMLIQTDRLGTSIAHALRAHAESMRIRRRQRAEQLARKAAVKLAFPLVFLVLPALLIIILGPAAIQLLEALVGTM